VDERSRPIDRYTRLREEKQGSPAGAAACNSVGHP